MECMTFLLSKKVNNFWKINGNLKSMKKAHVINMISSSQYNYLFSINQLFLFQKSMRDFLDAWLVFMHASLIVVWIVPYSSL